MFQKLRVDRSVFSIVSQKSALDQYFDIREEQRGWLRMMHSVIMEEYNILNKETKLKSNEEVAITLCTATLLTLESSLIDNRDYKIMASIETLKACMIAFGKMRKQQIMVATYLKEYENYRSQAGT